MTPGSAQESPSAEDQAPTRCSTGTASSHPRHGSRDLPGSEGRWWLIRHNDRDEVERAAAMTQQPPTRSSHREAVMSEHLAGGFSRTYSVLKLLEERGSVRRGYFVDGLGPSQFCLPGAEDRLRRKSDADHPWMVLAAVDPANVYGAAVSWPKLEGRRFERATGAYVILHEGALVGFLSRSGQVLNTQLSDDLPQARKEVESIVNGLRSLLSLRRTAIHLETIDGAPALRWVHAALCKDFGFHMAPSGLMLRMGPAPGLRHARR